MRPFEFSASLAAVTDHYPVAKDILRVSQEGEVSDRVAIARQWLSEGIPFAFKQCPAVYESMRSWLGWKLCVEAKEISLTGSARLGSSLSPKKLGRPFGPGSDLDLFVVSETLFQSMTRDFQRWLSDLRKGDISPINKNEGNYWPDNKDRGPKLIKRGFMDASMIPTRGNYDSRGIHQIRWSLAEKLRVTPGAPDIVRASLRCYRSWKSFERQNSISLQSVANSVVKDEI